MACYLLHIVEQPDQRPYDDPDVKDVIGALPQFYCTHCDPIRQLRPGEAMQCLRLEEPCWKPADEICR